MATQAAPTVFLSHSHRDKRVARRLVSRLAAHGFKVWIDERELPIGAALTPSIRTHIDGADVVLVVASGASAASDWVASELAFARERGKVIVPLFIEPVAQHERFRDTLGVDATWPQEFGDTVDRLMRDLCRSLGRELPPADPAVLTAGLRESARAEPDLAPLIHGCLDSEGLHQDNMDGVHQASFHPLDEALNALFDLKPNEAMASHAAYGFSRAGAGVRALRAWIAATGDGGLPLATAVGTRLPPPLVTTAILLLQACDPPNDQALYNFIAHNATQLDPAQRRSVLRLVTWPVRETPDQFADVLGWVACKHFPDADEVRQMWCRWVEDGGFDGKPRRPAELARYLADADKEGLPGWDRVSEALRSHVRRYLRSGDKQKVATAMDHVQAAADAGAPVLAALLRETEGVSGTAEWEDWRKNDRRTADWMGWYVHAVAGEARGGRDWLKALQAAEQMVAFEEQRRQLLAAEQGEPDRGG